MPARERAKQRNVPEQQGEEPAMHLVRLVPCSAPSSIQLWVIEGKCKECWPTFYAKVKSQDGQNLLLSSVLSSYRCSYLREEAQEYVSFRPGGHVQIATDLWSAQGFWQALPHLEPTAHLDNYIANMHSHLYNLCLLAVYAVASVSANAPVHAHVRHLARARSERPFGTPAPLRERAQPMLVDEGDCDDDEEFVPYTTAGGATRTIVQAATQTRTKTVTRVTGTSTRVMVYTQTLTRTETLTRTAALAAQPTTSTRTTVSTTSTRPAASSAPATTTYTSLVTPIPTSKSAIFSGTATYFYTGLGRRFRYLTTGFV